MSGPAERAATGSPNQGGATVPPPLTIISALRLERAALRRGATPGATRGELATATRGARSAVQVTDTADAAVLRCGIAARRLTAMLDTEFDSTARAVAVVGIGGAVAAGVRPGDVVVADEVRDGSGAIRLPGAAPLATALRNLGLTVHVGPIRTTDHIVHGSARAEIESEGVLAVDMESAPVLRAIESRREGSLPALAAVRVIVDTPDRPLLRAGTVTSGFAALRTLQALVPALRSWAEATGPRDALVAAPRSFCAGVERAVDIVERALVRYPLPVFVRRQIVHNAHVVSDLERRGVVFVTELDEVPDGSTVVLSAHGVAPSVRDEADRRGLRVIDATCPLVAKVHSETRRFLARGDTVLLIGHPGHDETEGTQGEAPDRIRIVSDVEQARTIEVPDPTRVSYVTQTTLATDEVDDVAAELRRRFPNIGVPPTDDICYASTNRQLAVRRIAAEADVVLVLGSQNSSNSRRLVEVAERSGAAAHLIDDASHLNPEWISGARTVGITAGASAPSWLVDEVVESLRALGELNVREVRVAEEQVTFTLPKEVES